MHNDCIHNYYFSVHVCVCVRVFDSTAALFVPRLCVYVLRRHVIGEMGSIEWGAVIIIDLTVSCP